jgi:sugar O-acyltransferase (sialic acid O-acetyltransferase NeuD family)
MGKTLGILGSGHLGQQLAHFAISDNHYKKIVFFDDFAEAKICNGHAILGNTALIEEAFDTKIFDELIIGIGYRHMTFRKAFYERFANKIPFGNIIHSTAWIDPSATIGRGVAVYPGCLVDANVVIKDNVLMNIGCTVAHDTTIHSHCFLSPRVAIAGFTRIGEESILGINTTVIDNIEIAKQTQLGGGAIVIKNIVQSGLYVGTPVRFIR